MVYRHAAKKKHNLGQEVSETTNLFLALPKKTTSLSSELAFYYQSRANAEACDDSFDCLPGSVYLTHGLSQRCCETLFEEVPIWHKVIKFPLLEVSLSVCCGVGLNEYCMYQCLVWGMFHRAGDFGEVRKEWRVLKVGLKWFPRYASEFGFVLLLGSKLIIGFGKVITEWSLSDSFFNTHS